MPEALQFCLEFDVFNAYFVKCDIACGYKICRSSVVNNLLVGCHIIIKCQGWLSEINETRCRQRA